MNFYTATAAEAHALLSEFGQRVTLTKNSAGAYNPATGSATVTSVAQSTVGAVLEFADGVTNFAGALVTKDSKRVLLSTVGIDAPAVDDTIAAGGKTYTVLQVKATRPAGVPVLYECMVQA